MKYVIDIPEDIKNGVDKEDDVDKAEELIKWYSATLTLAIKDSIPLQEELEKIKAEINNPKEIGLDFYDGIAVAERIIDNHINKADCDNDCEHCTWTECPKE